MNSDGFELPSFAKVNLTLRVLGERDDGFHEVFTILQMVSLHDTLRFELMGGDIRLTCDDARIPTDSSNIVLRAAEKCGRDIKFRSELQFISKNESHRREGSAAVRRTLQ